MHLLLKFYYEIQMLEFHFNYITYTHNESSFVHTSMSFCIFTIELPVAKKHPLFV